MALNYVQNVKSKDQKENQESVPRKVLAKTLNEDPNHNPHNHILGTRFRYIVYGVPKNRYYTVEEVRWSWSRQCFVDENTFLVTSNTVKHWIGHLPGSVGERKVTMWLFLPYTIYNKTQNSPMTLWKQNHNVFSPYGFDKLRYFPSLSDPIYTQASQVPKAFRGPKPCEVCAL